MWAQQRVNRAPLRMVALLVVCLVGIALAGHWFTLPNLSGTPNWRLDFTAAEFARQGRYRSELSFWLWWAILSPWLTAAVFVLIRPLRMRAMSVVRGVHWLGEPGRAALLCALLLSATTISTWPAEVMVWRINRRWEMTSESLGGLCLSLARDALLMSVVVFAVGTVLLRVMRRWQRTWSTRIAAGSVVVIAVCGFLPALQGFLPERTTAVPPGKVLEQLEALKIKAGLPSVAIRVSASGGSDNGLNAYATGAGPWARVVLRKSSVKQSHLDELTTMVAHELGHVRARDPLFGALAGGCLTGILIAGIGWWQGRRNREIVTRLPLSPISVSSRNVSPIPVRVVPVLVLGWLSLQLAGLPLVNAVSRGIETRADVAALELTRDPQAFISMMRRVAVTNLAYVGDDAPRQWLRSHPTIVHRIANARAWAEDNGIVVPPSTLSPNRESGSVQRLP